MKIPSFTTKFLLWFLLTILLVTNCLALPFAFANTIEWVRIVNDQTPLYSSPDKSKVICWLEKSYYLKVLEQTGSLYLVELMDNSFGYPKILGYVDTLEVEICSSPPLAPTYPKTYVTVSSGGATIYVAPSLNSQAIYTATNNQKLNYFGTIEVDGQRWYFVWYCQQLGYVRSIFTTEPNVELHPTPLHPEPEPETNNPPPNHEGGKEENPLPQNNLTSWLMIGFVVLLATTLCMALFLPSKSKQQPIYFGED